MFFFSAGIIKSSKVCKILLYITTTATNYSSGIRACSAISTVKPHTTRNWTRAESLLVLQSIKTYFFLWEPPKCFVASSCRVYLPAASQKPRATKHLRSSLIHAQSHPEPCLMLAYFWNLWIFLTSAKASSWYNKSCYLYLYLPIHFILPKTPWDTSSCSRSHCLSVLEAFCQFHSMKRSESNFTDLELVG